MFWSTPRTFGLTQDDLDNNPTIPECKAFVHWRYHLAYKGDWLGAIAGIAFIEGASARRNDIIIDGLVEHYGFERGAPDLLFWELHASEIEEGHGDIGAVVVSRYANDAPHPGVGAGRGGHQHRPAVAGLRRHTPRLL